MSHFLQNQGNRGPIRRMGSPSKARTNQRITRRRTKVRRTCLRALHRQTRNPPAWPQWNRLHISRGRPWDCETGDPLGEWGVQAERGQKGLFMDGN